MDDPFDAQTLAWIERTEREGAPEDATIAQRRAAYEDMRIRWDNVRPEGMTIEDMTLAGRPARRYAGVPHGGGSHGRVLYFHGGGWVVGSLDTHDGFCAALAHRTECEVIALDYRLAPEHPFPAACDDALAAAEALDGPLILAGDSAGGTLAAGVAVALRGTDRIAGQVLIYPALGGLVAELASYTEKAEARLLTTADMIWYGAQWGAPEDDPRAAPLLADELTGIAPCVAFAAEEDPLRDDAVAWAGRLRAEGTGAQAFVEEGLPHGYIFARHDSARAEAAFGRIVEAVRGFTTAS